MKPVLVVEWVISHNHMRIMLATLKRPAHRHLGFYYEFEDFGNVWSQSKKRPDLYDPPERGRSKVFGDYGGSVQGGLLRVYRDVGPRVVQEQPITKAQVDVSALTLTPTEIEVLKKVVAAVLATKVL